MVHLSQAESQRRGRLQATVAIAISGTTLQESLQKHKSRAKDLNMEEGSSTTRPLLLKNDNYNYWKNQMRNLLRQNTNVWYVVENGPIIPMKDGPYGTKVPKGILEMDTYEAHLFSMDDRAKNIISCSLDINEYNRVSACETTREMWRLLEVTHEGTNQYEAFKMKENESINEMYSRFTLIINGLKLLGKTYPEKDIVRKFLRSLPKRWEAKLTAIQEAKDLNVLKLEELRDGKIRRSQTTQSHQRNNGDWNARENPDACYKYDRTGHIKKYCLQLKNESTSSSDRDTKEKKFKDGHSDEVTISENFDYDKLDLAFLELSENHEKLKLKNAALKKKALSLINIVEELVSEKEWMKNGVLYHRKCFFKN
ncbi:hypothetical protein RJ640_013843 [Escallonia rubra]|uniref:DUF4219 domain-containing protein n=1 Tax=Escallonia rubra TaxID=112253 RepID=A0AA88QSM6_9ASTE|nr:hypothetical protein RJ640_013843 [Escallonia rubra]